MMSQMQSVGRSGLLSLRAGLRPCIRSRRHTASIAANSVPMRPSGGGARMPVAGNENSQEAAAPAMPQPPVAPAPAAPAVPSGPQTVAVTGPVAVQAVLPPAALYEAVAALGGYKATLPFWKTVLLGAVAGCYVALGAILLLTVGPNCMGIASTNPGLAKYITGAIGFPYALLIILSCGAELFTGNTAVMTAAVYEGKATMKQLAKSWVASYLGNIIGCGLGVVLLLNTGLNAQMANGINAISAAKVAYPLKEAFVRAILANWFVCLAVWQSTAAQTFGGKFIACLGPVSAFVSVGLEHCIANMVFVPLGILTGVAGVTWQKFIVHNLIPVTIGNIVAGTLCVATVYALAYGKLGKKIDGTA